MNITDGINKVSNLRKTIGEFIDSQNIVGTVAGFTIAFSAGNTIRSFVNEIIFPAIYYLLRNQLKAKEYSPISYQHIATFSKELVTFILVLIGTIIFIKVIMSYLFQVELQRQIVQSSTATNGVNKGTNMPAMMSAVK